MALPPILETLCWENYYPTIQLDMGLFSMLETQIALNLLLKELLEEGTMDSLDSA